MSQRCFQRKSKIKRETRWHAYPFFGSFSVKSQWNNDDFSSCSKKITDTAYTGSVGIVTFLLISHSIVYDETILRMKCCSTSAIHLLSLLLPYGTWLRFVTATGRGDIFFYDFLFQVWLQVLLSLTFRLYESSMAVYLRWRAVFLVIRYILTTLFNYKYIKGYSKSIRGRGWVRADRGSVISFW